MPQKQAPHRLTDADRAQRMLHDLGCPRTWSTSSAPSS